MHVIPLAPLLHDGRYLAQGEVAEIEDADALLAAGLVEPAPEAEPPSSDTDTTDAPPAPARGRRKT